MGNGRQVLTIATIAMGVLILLGTAVVIGTIIIRSNGGGEVVRSGKPFEAVLDEPAGTGIAGIAPAGARLAIHLHGGGPDRVLLIDPGTGAVAGRVTLAR